MAMTCWHSFLVKMQPALDCATASFSEKNVNIWYGALGKDEISIGGTIKRWSATDLSHKTKIIVLLNTSHNDHARPQVADAMQNELKSFERQVFSKLAHLSMIDEPHAMSEVIQEFIDRVEELVSKIKKIQIEKVEISREC